MELAKSGIELFKEFGPGNSALLLILGLFAYFFFKLMPPAVERIVAAVESLGKTLAVHDERAVMLYQVVSTILADIQILKLGQIPPESITRLHERLDSLTKNQVTSIEMNDHYDRLIKEFDRHADRCERQNNTLQEALKI